MALAILTAVQQEFAAVRKLMPSVEEKSIGGITFVTGNIGRTEVILAKSGMGGDRAFRTAKTVLSSSHVSSCLIIGLGAGLDSKIAVGDVVVCSSLLSLTASKGRDGKVVRRAEIALTESGSFQWIRPDIKLVKIGMSSGSSDLKVVSGPILNVQKVVSTAYEKSLVMGFGAKALDMETLAVASCCRQMNIPWSGMRVISDSVTDDLPIDFQLFVNSRTGEVDAAKLARYAIMHPLVIPKLIHLGKVVGQCSKTISQIVEKYISGLETGKMSE